MTCRQDRFDGHLLARTYDREEQRVPGGEQHMRRQ